MPRTVSLGAMIRQLGGLQGTKDLSKWETEFLRDVIGYSNNGTDTHALSAKQAEVIERLYRKHFA
jgi:hypothetical protein